MANLFIDIETAPDMDRAEYLKAVDDIESGSLTRKSEDRERYWSVMRGGLTPFGGKVILITYKVNDAYTHRLKEWESDEKTILTKMYDLLCDLQKGYTQDRLKIIGHNILGFDLFFLYNRMRFHAISEDKWLYQWVINKPEVIDFLQIHLPLNDYNTKGLKHDVLAHAYGFPTKETIGSEETLHYYQKEYHKITEYSEREFIYPELYAKIKSDGVVSRQALQESIRWYDNIHKPENQTS